MKYRIKATGEIIELRTYKRGDGATKLIDKYAKLEFWPDEVEPLERLNCYSVYDKVSRHIFNWPNREECLREWYNVYSQSSFYAKGVELINDFFTKALKSELNRLMSNL